MGGGSSASHVRGVRGVSAGVSAGFPRGFRGVSAGFPGGSAGFRGVTAPLAHCCGLLVGPLPSCVFCMKTYIFGTKKHWSDLFPLSPLSSRRGLENVGEQPPFIILNREEGGFMCGGNGSLLQVLEFYRALV